MYLIFYTLYRISDITTACILYNTFFCNVEFLCEKKKEYVNICFHVVTEHTFYAHSLLYDITLLRIQIMAFL
jgi:hypothetical protein